MSRRGLGKDFAILGAGPHAGAGWVARPAPMHRLQRMMVARPILVTGRAVVAEGRRSVRYAVWRYPRVGAVVGVNAPADGTVEQSTLQRLLARVIFP